MTRRVILLLGTAALLGAAVFFWSQKSPKQSFRRLFGSDNRVDVPIADATAPGFPLEEKFAVWQGRHRGFGGKKSLEELFPTVAPGMIVNFWATWCPPCVEEFPAMIQLGNQLEGASDKKTRLVAIAVDDDPKAITRFLESLPYEVEIPILHDPGGHFAATLGTTKFPETYWVTRDGQVPMRWVGPQDWLGPDVLATLRTLTEH